LLFNSYTFLFAFLPISLAGFFALRRQAPRLVFLVGASYVFYAYANWWFPALMAGSTAIAFTTGRLLGDPRNADRRGRVLAIGVSGALGLLVYFKYASFVARNSSSILSTLTGRGLPSFEAFTSNIVLPIGISFFTFEAISYMVDVYRRDIEPERNPVRFAFFISFFPHLVAGPIVRYDKLRPQLRRFYRLDPDLFVSGVSLVCIGLIKKVVIADSIAARTDAALAAPGSVGAAGAWLGIIGYSFQIYFDFAGYCDMALGLARMFGIELPWNFDRPYRARNPREFWRRWHVTLSSWLRDYLYIPLGGSRRGEHRRDLNLLGTMALGGLWHGAAFSFAAWGLYHGVLLVAHRHLSRLGLPLRGVAATAATFLAVTIGWVFFRMHGAHSVASTLAGLGGLHGLGAVPVGMLPWLLVAAALMWGVPEEWRWQLGRWPTWGLVPIGLATAVALVLVNSTTRFIYFRF
jgi:D-alanyl-lipoteichoic acid acyltransferase DltB (MBOAT superfamily)